MWISRNEYERLQDCEKMMSKLNEENKRLAELVSSKVDDCKIGPWCKDCLHIGRDQSVLKETDVFGNVFVRKVAGKVLYCKKHLHELCPEFELK